MSQSTLGLAAAFVVGVSIMTSCHNDNVQPINNEELAHYRSDGIITGPDMKMCPSPCCGGWIIDIDSAYYTFSEVPDASGIDLNNEKFPLAVDLEWFPDSTLSCNHIFVTWIKVIPPNPDLP